MGHQKTIPYRNMFFALTWCALALGSDATVPSELELGVSLVSRPVDRAAALDKAQIHEPWHGSTIRDLRAEYGNIFRRGNRNAASHLWSSFLLQRSKQMTPERLETLFTGFCAVSGSPVSPNPYSRYKMVLDRVDGTEVTGFTYYCCWPCVCDTQDFIRVDTLTVPTAEGPKQYQFLVIGDPCLDPQASIPWEAWGRSSGKLRASVRSLPVGGRARSVRQQSSSGAPAKPPLHGRVFNRVRRRATQNCFLHRYET